MRRMTLGLVLGFLLMAPALAGDASVKALYVFGDSLSDPGNAAALSVNAFPPSPPYAHRFSNGPVAAEYLARRLDVPATPATFGGTNFAVGGATTGVQNFNFEVGSPPGLPLVFRTTGIRAQIVGALATGPAFNPGRTLFLVWGGPNDVFLALARDPAHVAEAVAQAIHNLVIDVALLAQGGGRLFLVPNMADLGATPFGASLDPARRAGLTALTQAFNAGLTFAMTDTSSACLDHPAALPACMGFLFFDSVHPTTAAHRILARRFAEACEDRWTSCESGGGRSEDVEAEIEAEARSLPT